MLLFIYGTLKRGQPAHAHLARTTGEATFVSVARTAARYRLLDLGPYPALVDGHAHILGELWHVDADTLARLDEYEDVPTLYQRRPIDLAEPIDTSAQAYFLVEVPPNARDCGEQWPPRRDVPQ